MKRPSLKSAVIGVVILFDTAALLFPDWVAVNPSDLSPLPVSLGHAWLTSPPPPPEKDMVVRIGKFWVSVIALITVGGILAYISDKRI